MTTINNSTAIVTRFNTIERDVDGEVIDTLRLFAKRTLVGEIAVDDITRYEGDFDADDLTVFLGVKGRTVTDVMDFLGEDAADDDDEIEGGGSIVPEKYRVKYGVTQRCGDDVAETLSAYVTLPRTNKKDIDGGLDRAKLREVADANNLGKKLDEYEARELNGGLLRMNISNILRGMVRRGEQVTIGAKVWEANPALIEERKAARKQSRKSRRAVRAAAKAPKAAKPAKAKKGK